jgi:glutamate-1-semialdehyde 2,1-aminomutase
VRPAGRSAALFRRAEAVTPGGVSSPVRAFRSVGGDPYFVASGSGAHITDVDGNVLLDYVQSWGASILGHAHPRVVEAVTAAARRGTTFGAPTENEVLLAEAVVEAVPSVEMVRFVSSGTEAAMTAIRLARGVTGRSKIITFAGCYHGHSDALLAAGGSGVATLGIPGSAGVPIAAVGDTIVAPYNVVPEIDGEVACVIVEPVAANMGLVPPGVGFLRGLRDACDAAGALLIFDEVITGFRLSRAGASGKFGIDPDLSCFGKVLGGGLPLAAIAGRRELLSALAPVGLVYQAGTLSGNPLATAAGLAVLELLSEETIADLTSRVARFANDMREAIRSAGIPVEVPVAGPLLGIFFGDEPVENYEDAKRSAETGRYAPFFRSMLDQGIALAPSAYEVAFPSLAHTDDDFDRTVEAASVAAKVVAAKVVAESL